VAKKLKRKYITTEISERYFDVINKRLNGQIAEVKRNKEEKREVESLTLF